MQVAQDSPAALEPALHLRLGKVGHLRFRKFSLVFLLQVFFQGFNWKGFSFFLGGGLGFEGFGLFRIYGSWVGTFMTAIALQSTAIEV